MMPFGGGGIHDRVRLSPAQDKAPEQRSSALPVQRVNAQIGDRKPLHARI